MHPEIRAKAQAAHREKYKKRLQKTADLLKKNISEKKIVDELVSEYGIARETGRKYIKSLSQAEKSTEDPSLFQKATQAVGQIIDKVKTKESLEDEVKSPSIELSERILSLQETLKQKEEKIGTLQEQLNQFNPGGDEMANEGVQSGQVSTVDLQLGIQDLKHQIENTKDALELLRDDQLPRKIEDSIKPLKEKVTSQLAEVATNTASLSGALESLQKSLTEEISRQAEAKKETEAIKGELEETTKKADTISTLGEELKTSVTGVLEEKTKEWDEKIAELPTKEKVEEMVNQCILDPNSPVCLKLDELAKGAPGESDLEKSMHSTSEELLRCPTCGVAVTKRIMAALSEQGKGDIANNFLEAMSAAGYQTGQEPKKEEPVAAKEKPPGNPGEEEKVATPAGF